MMKKSVILFVLIGILLAGTASAAPYTSYMLDRDGWYRYSPSLYEPSHVLNIDVSGVTDLFIGADDTLYIPRLGSNGGEVLVVSPDGELLRTVGQGTLKRPNGVFVDDEGTIYVADPTLFEVLVFSADGELVRRISRPQSPLMSAKSPFVPLKVVVDLQKNMYILSEGNVDGMIQLDENGEFLGYFGANTSVASFIKTLQNLFYTEDMMNLFVRNIPPSMSNLAIDKDGLVYATTKGDTAEPLKKINIAGKNLFPDHLTYLFDEPSTLSLESVTVDQYGNVFTVSGETGLIFLLDSLGDIVGIFGARSYLPGEMGISMNPVGIAVNSQQTVYLADKGLGTIQVYAPTPYMRLIFSGLDLYRQGKYLEAEPIWQQVRNRNTSIALTNRALGLARLKEEDYAAALDYFHLANDKAHYADAFWELRQAFIMRHSTTAIALAAALVLLRTILNIIGKKTRAFDGIRRFKARYKATAFHRQVALCGRVLRKPADTLYDVRNSGVLSPVTALALPVLAVGMLIAAAYLTGFQFNPVNVQNTWAYSPVRTVVTYAVIGALFVLSNFLVASIREGRGRFVDVFNGTMVSLLPIIALYPIYMALSNVLSLQEVFVLDFFRVFIFLWMGLLILIMTMQIHDYDFGEAVLSLVLTVLTMVVIFVVTIVIFILAREGVAFFRSIFEEVFRRVQ